MQKLFSSLGIKVFFVALYIIANIWSAITIISNNKLIGDQAGWPAPDAKQILFALIFIIISYICMLFLGNEKKENEPKYKKTINSRALSITILCLQTIYYVFILVYGAGKASSIEKTGGALRFVFFIINPDMLFLIYYAATIYAKEKIPYRKLNLVLYFISNLTRGWIGQTLFIIFLETIAWGSRSNGKIAKKKIFVFVVISPLIFILSTYLLYLKTALRIGLETVIDLVKYINYTEIFNAFFEALFSRLQLLSTVSFQIYHKDELAQFIENGIVGNFFTDSLYYQTICKMLDISYGENLNLFLWKNYIVGGFPDFEITFQPGLIGWAYLLPYYWILPFVMYITLLIFLNFKFIGFLGGNGLRNLSWFAVLIFLIPSWLGAYTSFVHSLCIFIGIVMMLRVFTERRKFIKGESITTNLTTELLSK